MGNSRVLQKATKELTKAKAPKTSKDIIYDPTGYWNPNNQGQPVRIPLSDNKRITMQNNPITNQPIPYPVYAQPNVGQPQMMYPGQDYVFPGADYVDEQPQMKKGGRPRGLVSMPKPSKKGLASKAYSRSLDATNKLFTENNLFKKPKDKRRKVFDPNAKYYAEGGEQGCPEGYVKDENDDCVKAQAHKEIVVKAKRIDPTIKKLNRLREKLEYYDSQNDGLGPTSMSDMNKRADIFKDIAELETKHKKKLRNTPRLNQANAVGNIMLTAGKYFMPKQVQTGVDYLLNVTDTHEYLQDPDNQDNQSGVASNMLSPLKSKRSRLAPFSTASDVINLKQQFDKFQNAKNQEYQDGGEYGMPLGTGVSQNFIGNRDEFKVGGIPELPLRDNQVNYDAYVNRFEPKTRLYEDGGITKLTPEEEKQFKKFYKTLPDNLQTDDNTYDIRGYWDSEGRPEAFNYDQPKEKDGYYHAYSINQNTGEYLKSPAHDTFQHAVDEDRKIGYRPLTNVYGRNIATENASIADPEEQSFLRNTEGPANYIETELTDDEIQAYRDGGYVVEDISVPSLTKAQKGGIFGRRKKKKEEQEQPEYVEPIKVDDEMYESVTPYTQAPEDFKKGVGNIKEVEKKAQAPDWLNFSREYEKKNSKQAFIDEKKREYLKGTNQGLIKQAGYNMENFPPDVERRFREAYDYKKNSFIVKKLGKKEKFSPNRRGEWVDELSDKEKEIVANSKYESKLQPGLWDRTLAGLTTLATNQHLTPLLAPIANKVMNEGMLPGLTKKEQKEIKDAKLLGLPVGGLESLAWWDAPGVAIANALEQSGSGNYGTGYREAPGVLSGQPMANVTPTVAMVMNPLNYTLPYDIAAAAPSIIRGAGSLARTTGKVLTEATPLKNAYKLNKIAIKENAVGPMVRTDKPHWLKGYQEPINSGVIDISDVIKKATPEDLTKLQLKDLEYKNKLRRNRTMDPEDISDLNKDIEQFISIEKFAKESRPEWDPKMSFDSPVQERRAFVKQMQKEGLVSNKLSKPAVSNIAMNEKRFNELTKKALEKFNEAYRNVDTNPEALEKLKDPELFNMFDKGVDITDPASVGEYMATTVPQEEYYYRQGFGNSGLGKEYDALYSHSLPSNDFGERMYKVKLGDTDFSTGDFKDWYQKNYKEKIRGYDPNIRGYHNENMFEPGVFGAIKGDQGAYRVFTGKRGEKVLTADPTYKYHGVNWKEMSPEQQQEMYEFFKAEKRDYGKGWYEPNKSVTPKTSKQLPGSPNQSEITELLNISSEKPKPVTEIPETTNKSFIGKVKDYFDRPPGPLMLGMSKGAVFNKEIKNPDYFLDLMKINKYSPKNKKYFEDLIATVKRQGNVASEKQYEELQRLKTGDMNYGKKGFAKGGIVSELSKKEIKDLVAQGYIVEDID